MEGKTMSALALKDDVNIRTGDSYGGGGGGGARRERRGPAQMIPFPVVRRVACLDNTAYAAAGCRNPSKYLASAYRQQENTMRRKGISEDIIESELKALHRAIQARLGAYA
jgi:hypothetical protein